MIAAASLAEIENEPELLTFAIAGGAAAFADNCAPCHGAGAQGAGLSQPERRRLAVGRHARGHPARRSRTASAPAMPRRATSADAALRPRQHAEAEPDRAMLAEYVLSLSRHADTTPPRPSAASRSLPTIARPATATRARATGNSARPNLTDDIWLYGGAQATSSKTIETGRGGVMPAWGGRLDPAPSRSWPSTSIRWAAASSARAVTRRAQPTRRAPDRRPRVSPDIDRGGRCAGTVAAGPSHVERRSKPGASAALCGAPEDLSQARAAARSAAQVDGDGRHARHLLCRCRGCAGIAGRTRRTRRSCSISPIGASTSSSSRSGRRRSITSPAC